MAQAVASPAPTSVAKGPPLSRRSDASDRIHGTVISDPYRWLEDSRSPEVSAWTEQQNAYARKYLDELPLHSALAARLKELLYIGDVDATTPRHGKYFFRRREPGQEKHRLYVKDGMAGAERVLVDPNGWPPDEHKTLQGYWPSPNGEYVALKTSGNNSDEAQIELIDGKQGSTVEIVPGVRYEDIVWNATGKGVYYTWYPSGSGAFAKSEVRFHALGTDPVKDTTIAPPTGQPDVEQYVVASPDGRWLILHKSTGWLKTDLYFADARTPTNWRPLVVGKDARYSAAAYKDGTHGFLMLMHNKNAVPDGSASAYLTGYGAHGISMRARYVPSTYAWLERGGVFARAIIRGGGEYGEEWHRQGMLTHKQNSIDDFIAAAEELVRRGWTRPERLVIGGTSMGGLLVAATVTQRPDLFGAAITEAPLTDLVRYPLSGAGKAWLNELGDPEKSDEFAALWGYSPYHHVRSGGGYPATLVMTSDSDDRVDPMHARKFVAALQNAAPRGPVLLTVEKNQGHNTPDTVLSFVNALSDMFAFGLAQMGGRADVPRAATAK